MTINMKIFHPICIRRQPMFVVCWLGSIFCFFVVFSSRLQSTLTINTTHNITSIPVDPNCSCTSEWNSSVTPTDRMKCCHRSVVSAHKMGWQLLIAINRRYLARITGDHFQYELYSVHHITIDTKNSNRNKEYELLMNMTYQQERDYRTVFVTRNWHDTIISGYLYHKSGRECWLSSGGKGGYSGWLLHFNWEEFLEKERGRTTKYWSIPIVIVHQNGTLLHFNWEEFLEKDRGRTTKYWPQLPATNLCKYLQLATPSDGLRVYADLAIAYWLNSLLTLANARNATPPTKSRTLFLCYDQFNVNEKFPGAIKQAGSFLYPSEATTQWDGMTFTNQGGGGHATTIDNVIRMGLHSILRIIDSVHFDGEINAGSSKFGCSSEADNNLPQGQNHSRVSHQL